MSNRPIADERLPKSGSQGNHDADETMRPRTLQTSAKEEGTSPVDLWLVDVDSPKAPIRVPLDRDKVVLGSDEQCDVSLPNDPYVSRRHARITRHGDLVLVEDLASSNGTFIRVRRAMVLEPGDDLLIGTSLLRLERTSV